MSLIILNAFIIINYYLLRLLNQDQSLDHYLPLHFYSIQFPFSSDYKYPIIIIIITAI